MKGKDQVVLSKEMREEMVAAIQDYFVKERGQEMGRLAASFVLDFFIENLAPEFYNRGVIDAYKFMSEKTEDLQLLLK